MVVLCSIIWVSTLDKGLELESRVQCNWIGFQAPVAADAHLTLQQTLNLHLVCPLGTDMTLRLERRIKRTVCIFLKSSNIP